MRKIINVCLVLVLLIIGNQLHGQSSLPFNESFSISNGTIPTDWYSMPGKNLLNVKEWGAKSNEMQLSKENNGFSGTSEAWLITPLIQLRDGANVLTFNEYVSSQSNAANFYVKISTTSQSNHDEFSVIESYTEHDINTSSTERSIDLSDFYGQQVYIAFIRSNVGQGVSWTIDDVAINGSNISEVSDFTVNSVTSSSIDLSWSLNSNTDDIIVAWNSDGNFGSPVDGSTYIAGETFSGGASEGTILFVGSATTFSHSGLNTFTPYYYKIWSVNDLGSGDEYAFMGQTTNATTIGNTVEENTDFEADYNGWTYANDVSWGEPGQGFRRGTATSYRGEYAAYMTTDRTGASTADYNPGMNSPYPILTKNITIDGTKNYLSAELSFFWKSKGSPGLAYGELYINAGSGDVLLSSAQQYVNQSEWIEEVIDMTDYIGTTFDLTFKWSSSYAPSGSNPGLCVDDIRIYGSTVSKITNFVATVNNTTSVDLTFDGVIGNDDVLIAYSADGNFGAPTWGQSYAQDDVLPGGGKVIYFGTGSSFSHTNVPSGVAYYKAWRANNSLIYSVAVDDKTAMPVSLPYVEDFEGVVSEWNLGETSVHKWVVGRAEPYNNSSKSAYVSVDNGLTASYYKGTVEPAANRIVQMSLPVDLRGFTSVDVSYNWQGDMRLNNIYGRVLLDDGSTETVLQTNMWEQTSIISGGVTGQTAGIGKITNLVFEIFFSGGGGGNDPGLCVDDVSITGLLQPVSGFTATNQSTNINNLSWTKFDGGSGNTLDEVVVAYNLGSAVTADLSEGVSYEEGDELSDGSIILYVGSADQIEHQQLRVSTTYHYRIWHKSGYIYSTTGVDANATTPDNVGFFEDFESGTTNWTLGTDAASTNAWYFGNPDNVSVYAGSNIAFVTLLPPGTSATYDKGPIGPIELVYNNTIDLAGYKTAHFSFYYYVGGQATDYGSVWINEVGQTNWQQLGGNLFEQPTWTEFSEVIPAGLLGKIVEIKFIWTNTGSKAIEPGLCIDNVLISGTFDDDSELSAGGASLSTSISSVDNAAQANALTVLDFNISDLGTTDGKATIIHQIALRTSTNNNITDLRDVIAGVQLTGSDLGTGNEVTGVINSSSIVFSQEDMISVADGNNETYEVKLWLRTPMLGVQDNNVLGLEIRSIDIISYDGSGVATGSIVGNDVTIGVIATELNFTTEPSGNVDVNTILPTQPIVEASDVYGNLDLDFDGISVSLSSTPSLTPSNNTATSSAGVATFANLSFVTSGGPVVLDANGGGLSGSFSSITVSDYCAPDFATNDSYISVVSIENIDNYTEQNGDLGYYTDQSTSLTLGNTYSVSVVTSSSSLVNIKVYINYNVDANSDFNDAGEIILSKTANGTNIVSTETFTVPVDATLGATRMRVMVSSDSNMTGCDPDGSGDNSVVDGEAEDYTIYLTNPEWLGKTPVWDASVNWSNGTSPNGLDIYIPEHPQLGNFFPVFTGTVSVNDVSIDANAKITIDAGTKVTIAGSIDNAGDIIVNNASAAPASLKVDGSASGNVTYNWNWSSSEYLIWWYMAHPVSGFTVQDYKDCVGAAADQNGDGIADGNDFRTYVYDVSVPGWVNKTSNVSYSFSAMEAVAFKVKNPSSVLTYTGELNADASYPFNASVAGVYHKVGNPYSSYMDLEAIDYGSFSPTTYIYEASSNSYLTYNGSTSEASSGASRYIAPGQSFWIYANNATDVLTVTKSLVCVHPDVAIGLKGATSTIEKNKIRLKISNANTNDEVLVLFSDYGSNEFTNHDSRKYMVGGKSGNFYTIKNDIYTVINSMPSIQDSELIPLGYKVAESGMADFTFEVNDFSGFDANVNVYLEDLEEEITINLREEKSYTFTPKVAHSDERFILRTELAGVTTDEKKVYSASNVVVYAVQQKATIRVDEDFMQNNVGVVEIYNVAGQLVAQQTLNSTETHVNLPQANTVYIIKVSIDSYVYQGKVLSM